MKISVSVTISQLQRVWSIYNLLRYKDKRSVPITKTYVLGFLKRILLRYGIDRNFLMEDEDSEEINNYLNGNVGDNERLKEAIRLEYDLFQKTK